jgi:hypothetical protein
MVAIYTNDALASFEFIGAASDGEAEADSKRFRIYDQTMVNFFSPDHFQHAEHTLNKGASAFMQYSIGIMENLE